ncbi:MAG: CcmD family protein [Bacteroidia bacterium]|nr:CcmD family protein [Bacteroidia bacterium]
MRFIINQIQSSNMADAASTDKFQVVVAVIAVIFLGIVAYLISLDFKIKKQENK